MRGSQEEGSLRLLTALFHTWLICKDEEVESQPKPKAFLSFELYIVSMVDSSSIFRIDVGVSMGIVLQPLL